MIARRIVRFALITVGGWIVSRVVDKLMSSSEKDGSGDKKAKK